MLNKKPQTKTKQLPHQNPLEALKNFGGEFKDTALDQIFGKESKQNAGETSGDLTPGQELTLSQTTDNISEKAPKLDIEPGINYRREILYGERKLQKENTQELSVKIEEIIIELKQLMNVSTELKVEFKQIATEQKIVNPGKYHVSFFEWVLLIVKQARMKVEDSAAWLAAFKSKKAKKQYWSMFKKHGTTFGLSNERVVSTQTG